MIEHANIMEAFEKAKEYYPCSNDHDKRMLKKIEQKLTGLKIETGIIEQWQLEGCLRQLNIENFMQSRQYYVAMTTGLLYLIETIVLGNCNIQEKVYCQISGLDARN